MGGIGVFMVVFALACVFIPKWFIQTRVEPTQALPGDATHLDPVQALPAVRSYVGGDAQIVSFFAQFVRVDGTVDLEASYSPSPAVRYVFSKAADISGNKPPIGTGGGQDGLMLGQTVNVTLTRPGQRFFVTKRDGMFSSSYSYTSKGMQKTEEDPRMIQTHPKNTLPICSLQELWRQAVEAGAPSDGVATITYTGDLYTFSVYGRSMTFAFSPECSLMNAKTK
ncbi:hypothetical protein KBB27_00555 [Patescibacteria group bacterium]|nr:hypothetical protein [Patescibacteria group bacterium]